MFPSHSATCKTADGASEKPERERAGMDLFKRMLRQEYKVISLPDIKEYSPYTLH